MKKSFISVVIPTLNEEKYLPRLLKDLVNQKEQSFEVIVVDAKSSDNTKSVVDSFKKDLNLQFITTSKRNVSYQRNIGAKRASSKYIAFIDADTRITSTYLKKIKKEIQTSKYLIYIPSIIPQDSVIHDKVLFNIVNFLIGVSQHTLRPFSSGGTMFFQREFFLSLGGFNERLFLCEDHDIIQRAKKSGVTAKMLKNIKVKFSTRRFKREGRFDVFIKYLISTAYTLKSGGINKKIYDYQMGGAHYGKKEEKILTKYIKDYAKILKNYIKKLNGNI